VNRLFVLLAMTIGFVASAVADGTIHGDIHVMKPWSRPLPAVSVNGAAYMTLMNMGDAPDRLLSVSSPIAKRAEVHTHIMEGGLMKMRPAGIIEIPPGASAVMQPGGLHVMLMGLTEPLTEGKRFSLTLDFERAGSIEIEVMVSEPGDAGDDTMSHDMKKPAGS
jgi:hypothetical protein